MLPQHHSGSPNTPVVAEMAPQQALELILDSDSDHTVRQCWKQLADSGLPSQAQHQGATNAPHVTVFTAPLLEPEVTEQARMSLNPLLPATFRVSGLVVFGAKRMTVAWLLEAPEVVDTAVRALRQAGVQASPSWLPHVTLGRRIHKEQLPAVMEVLPQPPAALTVQLLRAWDPTRRR